MRLVQNGFADYDLIQDGCGMHNPVLRPRDCQHLFIQRAAYCL